VSVEMRNHGLLFAYLDADHARAGLASLQPLREVGQTVPDTVTLGADVRRIEPALAGDVAAVFCAQDERHVVPSTLTAGLAARLVAMGARIHAVTAVTALRRSGSRWSVQTPSGSVDADDVVVAAGAWSSSLVRPLGVPLPLASAKGYSFSIRPRVVPRQPLYLAEAKVGCTPLGESVRLAGTMELSGLDTRIRRHRIEAIARSARRFLGDAAVSPRAEEWAGLRPIVPDGLPVIGPAGPQGLWLATGHSMLGVTLGPTTGRVLADQMTGRGANGLEAFSPARFGGLHAAQPAVAAAAETR